MMTRIAEIAERRTYTDEDRRELAQAKAILKLYPAPTLPERERTKRVLKAREIARQRLLSCTAANANSATNTAAFG